MNETEVARCMLMLKAAFPRGDASLDERVIEAREKLYASKFAKLDYPIARLAIEACVDELTFYPAWSEILERYNRAREPRPELRKSTGMYLPKPGETVASPEEARAANQRLQELIDKMHVGGPGTRETP
jgi:hypothetical protein